MIKLDEVFCINGFSVGSQATCLWIKSLDVLFDIGAIDNIALAVNTLLLSHAHGDHSGALMSYLSQRRLFPLPYAKIYVPAQTKDLFVQMLSICQKLEDLEYHFEIIGAEPGKRYELKKNFFFMASPVQHRVPALGYTIYEEKKKLKQEYISLSPEEIKILREKGIEIFSLVQNPVFSYLGDCTLDSYLQNEAFRKSKYLVLECTFLDSKRTMEHARHWGHIHLEEILQSPDVFSENQKLLLIHFSARYHKNYVEKVLKTKCPPCLLEKIVLLA